MLSNSVFWTVMAIAVMKSRQLCLPTQELYKLGPVGIPAQIGKGTRGPPLESLGALEISACCRRGRFFSRGATD